MQEGSQVIIGSVFYDGDIESYLTDDGKTVYLVELIEE
jgi:hypothetical protein